MSDTKVHYFIVGVWGTGFVYCLAILLRDQGDIPNLAAPLLNEVLDAFAPALTMMFAFLFSEWRAPQSGAGGGLGKALIAMAACFTYVAVLTLSVHEFGAERLTASVLFDRFDWLSTRGQPVVGVVLGYYFAERLKAAGVSQSHRAPRPK